MHRAEAELAGLERAAEEVVLQLDGGTLSCGQARTSLANVEARAHRLEADGVDGIYTSDLGSGKAQAKSEKKELLARLERLFSRLEASFQLINDVDPQKQQQRSSGN